MDHTYRIDDEPSPGTLAHIAVRPLWPLLTVMLGGIWLAWPWFALNSFAVGSPTQRREFIWLIVGIVGTVLLTFLLSFLFAAQIITQTTLPYSLIVLTVWKLGISYMVFIRQNQTMQIYEYYGGQVKSGVLVMIAAVYLSPQFLNLFDGSIWVLVLR